MVKRKLLCLAVAALAAAGCSGGKEPIDNTVDAGPQSGEINDVAVNDVAPAEPRSTTPAAARALVEAYAGLAEKGSFEDAAKLWTDRTAAAQFASSLEDYPNVRLTAGTPFDEEGAAGSIFIAVPLTLDLTLRSGSPYQMRCKATLRRVNDVPGSSDEQRRWHIESIDC